MEAQGGRPADAHGIRAGALAPRRVHPQAAALRHGPSTGRRAAGRDRRDKAPLALFWRDRGGRLGRRDGGQVPGGRCRRALRPDRRKFFGGSLEDLREVADRMRASAPALPCLRKDFMVHPIQVLEARESGASALLIIVRALDDNEIRILHAAAIAAGLAALFEVHSEDEIERAVSHGAELIGVNNRDLTAFTTDPWMSERLIPRFPEGVVTSE